MKKAIVKAQNTVSRVINYGKASSTDLSNAYHTFSILYEMVESLKDVRFYLLQEEIKKTQKMIKDSYLLCYKGVVLEDNKIEIEITSNMKEANLCLINNAPIKKEILNRAIDDYSTLLFCLERLNAHVGHLGLFCKEISERLSKLYNKLANKGYF